MWNAAFGPISVLSGGLTTDAFLATQEPFVAAIMDDVCRVAAELSRPTKPACDRTLKLAGRCSGILPEI